MTRHSDVLTYAAVALGLAITWLLLADRPSV